VDILLWARRGWRCKKMKCTMCILKALKTFGVSLRYAERKMHVKWGSDENSKPMPVNVLYVVGFPLGKEPEQFATPRSGGIGL
jgi:hypothetical protein